MNKNHLVSVITVVFNGVNYIEDTILSVLNQTYKNMEYIIIDGGSTDGTVDIIKKYENKITFWISEKDNGIYDAMNKGTLKSKGKWLNYMNCGDKFYTKDTVQKVINYINLDTVVVYGNTEIVFDKCNKYVSYSKKDGHKYHHQFMHQSAFIARSIALKYPYDINFKIAGDTDFFAKLYNKQYKFQHINLIISSFVVNGISSKLSWQMFKEDVIIGQKYNKFFFIMHTMNYIPIIIKRVIVKILPKDIGSRLRVLYNIYIKNKTI
ncbi:MAG: glycosyltransferase [Campylobacteraceae bacterium]|jgi:glycosyltransferase involved in cell wall biosynthesis|nr:glycosyltransferase [Campylobacteraceae bacterium]